MIKKTLFAISLFSCAIVSANASASISTKVSCKGTDIYLGMSKTAVDKVCGSPKSVYHNTHDGIEITQDKYSNTIEGHEYKIELKYNGSKLVKIETDVE